MSTSNPKNPPKTNVSARDFDGTQTESHANIVYTINILDKKKTISRSNHTHNILSNLGIPPVLKRREPIVWDMSTTQCQQIARDWAEECEAQGINKVLGLKNATYDQITTAILDQHLCNKDKPYAIKFREGESHRTKQALKANEPLIDVTYTNFPLFTDALRTRATDKGGLGLRIEEARKIPLIAGFPVGDMKGENAVGKEEHINLGMQALKLDPKNVHITLRDDDKDNIEVARRTGHSVIWANDQLNPKNLTLYAGTQGELETAYDQLVPPRPASPKPPTASTNMPKKKVTFGANNEITFDTKSPPQDINPDSRKSTHETLESIQKQLNELNQQNPQPARTQTQNPAPPLPTAPKPGQILSTPEPIFDTLANLRNPHYTKPSRDDIYDKIQTSATKNSTLDVKSTIAKQQESIQDNRNLIEKAAHKIAKSISKTLGEKVFARPTGLLHNKTVRGGR